MATYVKPTKGAVNAEKYGSYTPFGMGMPARAKQQKDAAAKPGAGAWGLGFDPDDPNVDAQVTAWLAKHQRPDGTFVDNKGRPSNWLNKYYNQVLAENPGIRPVGALDVAFRMQYSESAKPPKNFFTEYLLDPLVSVALGAIPVVGPLAATGYGIGRGASQNGLLGAITGGLGGYGAGQFGANVARGISAAGGVGNYLSNAGKSAYNAVTNLPSTLGNIGKDISNYYQYGPELTNVNAALGGSAASGMAAGASGAMRAAASGGSFLNNLLPGGGGASSVGTLGSSAGGGGMNWGDVVKLAVDVGVPLYTANKTKEALKEGAAAQTTATKDALALQREMFNEAVKLQQPWQEAGTNALAEQQRLLGLGDAGRGTPGYGSLAKSFSMTDFKADPGYAFRLREGQKALERSAAARGGLLSGGTGAALTRYGQEMGSQEYQNAFNRYQVERDARLNPLQSLSGQGLTTAGTLGTAGQNYANTAGELTTDMATINAARGIYGTAAQNQMINQIMGRVSTYLP